MLARLVTAWAAAGVLLTAFLGPLIRALSFFVFAFWIAFGLAGAILGALAFQQVRHASSRAAGVALAAVVPGVTAGPWYGAELLRASGHALVTWVNAS